MPGRVAADSGRADAGTPPLLERPGSDPSPHQPIAAPIVLLLLLFTNNNTPAQAYPTPHQPIAPSPNLTPPAPRGERVAGPGPAGPRNTARPAAACHVTSRDCGHSRGRGQGLGGGISPDGDSWTTRTKPPLKGAARREPQRGPGSTGGANAERGKAASRGRSHPERHPRSRPVTSRRSRPRHIP